MNYSMLEVVEMVVFTYLLQNNDKRSGKIHLRCGKNDFYVRVRQEGDMIILDKKGQIIVGNKEILYNITTQSNYKIEDIPFSKKFEKQFSKFPAEQVIEVIKRNVRGGLSGLGGFTVKTYGGSYNFNIISF